MPSSDEEEEIYDGEDFHAALLACPAVVGDLVNIPVDLLPRNWVVLSQLAASPGTGVATHTDVPRK